VGLEETPRASSSAPVVAPARRSLLAFIDVDGLKAVNDSQGHAAGDALLRAVVESLRAHVRPYDVIVRYGGDEFICVMPDLSEVDARARFLSIRDALASPRAMRTTRSASALARSNPSDSIGDVIARAPMRICSRVGPPGRAEPPEATH